ncbi:MAG: DUF3858 domain-containing protein [bacterium]|nr:DUF3858 domain-containing protein [bacterium]
MPKTAIKRIFFLVILITGILSQRAITAEDPGVLRELYSHEEQIMKDLSQGDYNKLYSDIESFVTRYPLHPVSTLYYPDLVRLAEAHGNKKIEESLTKLIKTVEEKNPAANEKKNIHLLQLKLQLEKLLYRYAPERAKKISQELKPVRKWILTGCYNTYGPGDMIHSYLPEIISDDAALRGSSGAGTGQKRKKVVVKNYDGTVDIKKELYPYNGVAYATASFPVSGPVKIRIYSHSYYKIYINGREAAQNLEQNFRNQRVIRVAGTKGISLMIKLDASKSATFRVLVTDDSDVPRTSRVLFKKAYHNAASYKEENPYPHAWFSGLEKNDPYQSYLYRGIYFNELESEEAIAWHRKALAKKRSIINLYYLSSTMLDLGNEDRSSAYYIEGWRIINEIYNKAPDFVPARYSRFLKLVENKNPVKAYREGERLIEQSPNYLLGYIDFLDFLEELDYEKEFEEYLALFKKKFPHSVYPLYAEARYCKTRDRKRYIAVLEKTRTLKISPSIIKKLGQAYAWQGNYSGSASLFTRYNYNNEFTGNIVDNHIKKGDYSKARKLVLQRVSRTSLPSLYYKLGLIDSLKKSDPLMYWQKVLALNPSLFDLSEYVSYLSTREITQPFARYIDESKKTLTPQNLFNSKKIDPAYPATVLYKNRIFLLQEWGSNRVYCEDIIYLANERGVDQWGEYRIPYKGKFYPIRVRVYHKDGRYSDSYGMQKIDGVTYLNLSSLKKDSIIHISYVVNNPVKSPRKSLFFSIPFTYLQNYNEPVEKILIKVVAPEKTNLSFYLKGSSAAKPEIMRAAELDREKKTGGWQVRAVPEEGKMIYSIELSGLKAIDRESFIGSSLTALPNFSFTTMNTFKDFITWYNGLLRGKDMPLTRELVETLKKEIIKDQSTSTLEVIKKVYDFVSREIDLQKNVLYYPERPHNVLAKKRGTVEDKAILAKAILESLGIRSYIAFTGKQYWPDFNGFISPYVFSNILLYVPLDLENSLWIDFSSKYYRCGMVTGGIEGSKAHILLKKNFEIKKVVRKESQQKKGTYHIRFDNKGNAQFKIMNYFQGRRGIIRKYFDNKIYNDDIINSFYGRRISLLNVDTYKLENLEDYNKDFSITLEGSSLGLAITGAKKIIFQPVLKKSSIYRYIRYPKRELPLVILSSLDENEEYRYTLPEAYHNQVIQKQYKLKNRFGYADFEFTKNKGSNELKITRKIGLLQRKIEPADYGEFLKFCMDLKKIEFQNITVSQ